MGDKLTGVRLADAFLNERKVVLIQSEVLVHGFVQDKAAVAPLQGGDGIKGFDLVAVSAKSDCLLLHALKIRCNTAEDNTLGGASNSS
jgi:hypothetical protein